MKLVRVGERIINLELVTDIVREGDTISLFFALLTPQREPPLRSPAREMAPYLIQCTGAEAAALWAWLAAQADTVWPPSGSAEPSA